MMKMWLQHVFLCFSDMVWSIFKIHLALKSLCNISKIQMVLLPFLPLGVLHTYCLDPNDRQLQLYLVLSYWRCVCLEMQRQPSEMQWCVMCSQRKMSTGPTEPISSMRVWKTPVSSCCMISS